MRKFKITVNSVKENQYEVEVEEVMSKTAPRQRPSSIPAPQPRPKIEQTPAPKARDQEVIVPKGSETVQAPLPGTVVRVAVNEGDSVKTGQVLVVLEAMKMENEILAPRNGKVASIAIAEGASVNTGDALLVLE
ncbi:MAG: DUF2118 domain-containing protein [Bacillota bacterium]|jgi:biotin carboxyl carrier protein